MMRIEQFRVVDSKPNDLKATDESNIEFVMKYDFSLEAVALQEKQRCSKKY
jgi:hypothetical protein